ncbi:hypothetical protein HMPREF1508_1908 [Shuttleworthella sp. MSX8B]|nr:hypothetical protein HMPREF1508_1908 [Shuttleworthia sp. MSX8B]
MFNLPNPLESPPFTEGIRPCEREKISFKSSHFRKMSGRKPQAQYEMVLRPLSDFHKWFGHKSRRIS